MGCLVIGLYVLGFLFFFLIGIAAWPDGDYAVSIILNLLSFVFVFFMIRKAEKIKPNNTVINKNSEADLSISISSNIREVSDEELKEEERLYYCMIEAILNLKTSRKYKNWKTIYYEGRNEEIYYEKEIDILSGFLCSFFNDYNRLYNQTNKNIIEDIYERYVIKYHFFIRILERNDFNLIYKKAKNEYRFSNDSSFPKRISDAVKNPSLFSNLIDRYK